MSYDLQLYRSNNKTLFQEGEVKEKLSEEFPYIKEYLNEDDVTAFEVGQAENEDVIDFAHQGEEKNYYWTYCSYSVDENTFNDFLNKVCIVARKLDLSISDPQTDPDTFWKPDDFLQNFHTKVQRFENTAKITKKVVENLPFILPTKEKHFIIYFIMTTNPENGKEYYITLDDNKLFASKVEVGESIKDVVDREIVELTGSSEYKLISIKHHDTFKDKQGNQLDRFGIYLQVPYFDPSKVVTKEKVVWEELV